MPHLENCNSCSRELPAISVCCSDNRRVLCYVKQELLVPCSKSYLEEGRERDCHACVGVSRLVVPAAKIEIFDQPLNSRMCLWARSRQGKARSGLSCTCNDVTFSLWRVVLLILLRAACGGIASWTREGDALNSSMMLYHSPASAVEVQPAAVPSTFQ